MVPLPTVLIVSTCVTSPPPAAVIVNGDGAGFCTDDDARTVYTVLAGPVAGVGVSATCPGLLSASVKLPA